MAKIRRNAPCPCGSSKKYKRCCLRKERSPPAATTETTVTSTATSYSSRAAEFAKNTSIEDILAMKRPLKGGV